MNSKTLSPELVKELEDGDDNKVYELVGKLEDKYELFIQNEYI